MKQTQIPLTIISGFLGVGKTTLLNQILMSEHGMRIALIVNDFGAINIDSTLISNVDEQKLTLSDGCICCSIRGSLYNTVVNLLEESQPPEYIIIEASGVADPHAIMSTLMAPMLRSKLRVDGLVTVIDAPQVRETSRTNTALIKQQITAANIILLNKTDLVTHDELVEVKNWLYKIAPATSVIETTHCKVPSNLLLAFENPGSLTLGQMTPLDVHVHQIESRHRVENSHQGHHRHEDHSIIFDSYSFISDRPLSLQKLRDWLKTVRPDVLRAKGFVVVEGDGLYLLNIAGRWRRLERYKDTLAQPITRTELVFIGKQGWLTGYDVESELRSCVT